MRQSSRSRLRCNRSRHHKRASAVRNPIAQGPPGRPAVSSSMQIPPRASLGAVPHLRSSREENGSMTGFRRHRLQSERVIIAIPNVRVEYRAGRQGRVRQTHHDKRLYVACSPILVASGGVGFAACAEVRHISSYQHSRSSAVRQAEHNIKAARQAAATLIMDTSPADRLVRSDRQFSRSGKGPAYKSITRSMDARDAGRVGAGAAGG